MKPTEFIHPKRLQLYRSWFQIKLLAKESKKFRVWTLLFSSSSSSFSPWKQAFERARWKIVRINLLMADSLEGINRLRKSCSTHAKNCGRISEIVSWLAPRELSIPFCSGARTKWRELSRDWTWEEVRSVKLCESTLFEYEIFDLKSLYRFSPFILIKSLANFMRNLSTTIVGLPIF